MTHWFIFSKIAIGLLMNWLLLALFVKFITHPIFEIWNCVSSAKKITTWLLPLFSPILPLKFSLSSLTGIVAICLLFKSAINFTSTKMVCKGGEIKFCPILRRWLNTNYRFPIFFLVTKSRLSFSLWSVPFFLRTVRQGWPFFPQ